MARHALLGARKPSRPLRRNKSFSTALSIPHVPSAYYYSSPKGLVDANALPDSGIPYSIVPEVIVRLFTDGLLKSALCLPSNFQFPCPLSQLLSRVFGGTFKLRNCPSEPQDRFPFERSEEEVLSVSYDGSQPCHWTMTTFKARGRWSLLPWH